MTEVARALDPTIADPNWTPEPLSRATRVERVPKGGEQPKWFKGPLKVSGQCAHHQWGASTYMEVPPRVEDAQSFRRPASAMIDDLTGDQISLFAGDS